MFDVIWIVIGLVLFVQAVRQGEDPKYLSKWPSSALLMGVFLYMMFSGFEVAYLYTSISMAAPLVIVREVVWLFLFLVRMFTYGKKFIKAPPETE